jgi:cyclase
VFLDITATVEKRKNLTGLVEKIAREINIPFTVGGGINSVEDAQAIIKAGADKVSINTAAVDHPEIVSKIAAEFGSQCVVLAIDTKLEDGEWKVYIHGGRTPTPLHAVDWALEGERRGAGEILLTSMNNDGTKNGFALDVTAAVSAAVNIPVVASGGAGTMQHFADVFQQTRASAALAASIFHFGEIPIPRLKQFLKQQNIEVRI